MDKVAYSVSSYTSSNSHSTMFNKIVQDFKKSLNEKHIPKSLVILNRLVLVLFFCILTLSSIEFGLKQVKINNFSKEFQAIIHIQTIASDIAELNTYIRSVVDIANNKEFAEYPFTNVSRFDYLTSLI